MKSIYVTDLQKNLIITNETFAVIESKRAEDKNGKPYYDLELGDKTGKVKAKIWSDNIKNVETKALKTGKVVQLSAKVEDFKGKLQLNVLSLNSIDESALEEFLEKSDFDADEMFEELLSEVEAIGTKEIRKVLLDILSNDDIRRRFKYWPAADSVHHDFRSGLLQHVLEMFSISKGLRRFYPDVNYDILAAGIVLHDIGKIYELDANGISTSYTTEGSLIGHIVIGVKLFDGYAKNILDLPTLIHIEHLILSHHGIKEYGSPILPATVEAIMLTYIDNLSAKSRTATKGIKNIASGEEFGAYNSWLNGVRLWNGVRGDNETIPGANSDVEQLSL